VELAGTLINTFVVVAVGAILAYLNNDRFKAHRRQMDSRFDDVKSDIRRLEDRLDAGLGTVHAEIVQVALAVGARGKTARG
jgi:uncharacterized protein YPO0396